MVLISGKVSHFLWRNFGQFFFTECVNSDRLDEFQGSHYHIDNHIQVWTSASLMSPVFIEPVRGGFAGVLWIITIITARLCFLLRSWTSENKNSRSGYFGLKQKIIFPSSTAGHHQSTFDRRNKSGTLQIYHLSTEVFLNTRLDV